jgi:hypothetical protein
MAAANLPRIFATPALLARKLGKKIGPADESEPQNARPDIAGDDQFDIAVCETHTFPAIKGDRFHAVFSRCGFSANAIVYAPGWLLCKFIA